MVRQGCRVWCEDEWKVEGMELVIGRGEGRGDSPFFEVGPRGGRAREKPGHVTILRFAGATVGGSLEEGASSGGVDRGRGGWFLWELELDLCGGGGRWKSRCRVVGLADRAVRRGQVRIGAWAVDRQPISGCAPRVGVLALIGDG